jgi:hypothetical protein
VLPNWCGLTVSHVSSVHVGQVFGRVPASVTCIVGMTRMLMMAMYGYFSKAKPSIRRNWTPHPDVGVKDS